MKLFTRLSLVAALLLILCNASLPTYGGTWSGWGGLYVNNRWSSSTEVSSSTIQSLSEHCKIPYPVGWQINATGIVEDFGALTTQQTTTTVPVSRSSPQIDVKNNILYFCTVTWALAVAADLHSGNILGIKQINPHPMATITMSPTFYDGILIVGVASGEEDAAFFLDNNVTQYPCCSFIGNMVALTFDRSTGNFTTVWDIPTISPDAPTNGSGSWSGVGVWGSQPAIDVQRRQVFFATGNVYTVPDAYLPCTDPTTSNDSCRLSSIWQESVLALDVDTGKPNWVHRLSPLDAWTTVCGIPGEIPREPNLCPQTPGPDADFGMAPAFVAGGINTSFSKDVITLGQKNGNLYVLDAATGEVEWATMTSPGGPGGGLMWGVAVDDARVYFTAPNSLSLPWTLPTSNITTNGSGFGAAELGDGKIVWSIAMPINQTSEVPPTVVGDLLLAGWTGPPGTGAPPVSPGPGVLLALNRETGAEVSRYVLDGPFYGGVAVQDNYLFIGTGYKNATGEGYFYVLSVKS